MRWHLRGALWALSVYACLPAAHAQEAPNIDVGLGYGQLRVLDLEHHGFAAQVHLPVTDSFGIEAYISRYWHADSEAFGVNTLGGRVTFREVHSRIVPYAAAGIDFFHINVVDAISGGTSSNSGVSALRFGGGTDVELAPAVALRFDSRFTPMRFFQQNLGRHEWRAGLDFSVGIAFQLPWSLR